MSLISGYWALRLEGLVVYFHSRYWWFPIDPGDVHHDLVPDRIRAEPQRRTTVDHH